MKIVVGSVCALLWLVYVGQFISSVNFPLAQRLGLQEKADDTDALASRLELGTARWDLLSLWTLPVACILLLMDHSWWPYMALIGGGVYVDTGGREAVKWLGLRSRGVRVGTPQEFRLAMGLFMFLVAVGAITIVLALVEVA
jgi:hypothetical protein